MKKVVVLLSIIGVGIVFSGCAIYPRIQDYGRTPDLLMQEALSVPDGQKVSRFNAESGYRYEVTPLSTYTQAGRICRKLSAFMIFQGRKEQVLRTACQFDGVWYMEEAGGWSRGYGLGYPYGRPYGHLNLWGNFNFQ
jgi:hypothetical protein